MQYSSTVAQYSRSEQCQSTVARYSRSVQSLLLSLAPQVQEPPERPGDRLKDLDRSGDAWARNTDDELDVRKA